MKSFKEHPSVRERKDVLDHIEDFIENHVERNVRRGIDEIERFVKQELLRQGKKKDEPSLFSYLDALREDWQVAALAPSTKFVVARVLKKIDWKTTRTIIEYGSASGVITKQLLARLPADGCLVAIETNAKFVSALSRHQDPRLRVIHGSVLELDRLLAPSQPRSVDAIVSGIPFSYLKPMDRHQLLHKTEERLRPGGRFIAYQVTTHLIPLMKYHFRDVDVQFEIRNLPPHFIFTGYK